MSEMSDSQDSDMAEPPRSDAPGETGRETPDSSLVDVDLAAGSHSGNLRNNNQDHYLAVRMERSLETILSNLPLGLISRKATETAYGMVVADGISGMPAGELASSMALSILVDLVIKTPDWVMRMNQRKASIVKRRLTERFRHVDITLREHGARDAKLAGMGTTMTVACSLSSDLFIAHIGDSRAYLLRADKLHQLTRDHTLAQAMIEAGVGDAEDETVRGMRRVLTAALGSTSEPCHPEVQRMRLRDGDQLLLCTDGLTESVDSEAITAVLSSSDSAEEACSELIAAALSAGGRDNVTVILARYRFPQIPLKRLEPEDAVRPR